MVDRRRRGPIAARRPPGLRRGFTLVELMLVVAIIGILTTFATPYFVRVGARARRAEMQVVLDKLHLYFINLYESSGSFVTPQIGAGATSAWNPDPATPVGQAADWVSSRSGWDQIPLAFDGGLKLRYQYTVTAPDTLTITVEGSFPGLGASIPGHSGNYLFVETLSGPTITSTELPEM